MIMMNEMSWGTTIGVYQITVRLPENEPVKLCTALTVFFVKIRPKTFDFEVMFAVKIIFVETKVEYENSL